MSRSFLTRRTFLVGLGASIAGVAIAACGGGGGGDNGGGQQAAAPTTAPAASNAAQPTPTQAAAAAAQPTQAPAAAATTAPAAQAGASGGTKGVSGTLNWLVRTTPQENNGQAQIFEPMIKAKYPDLKINRIIVPSEQYIPKINSMAAANESLEIWGFGGNYYDYWWRNLPQDLNQYIAGDKWDVDNYFLPGLPDIYKINGKHFGLPQLTCYGSNLVYNKDLLDAAGLKPPPVDWNDTSWTMDKLLEYAQKTTKNWGKPDAVYGVSLSLWDRMTSLSYLWGDDSWTPDHYTNFIAQKTNFANPGNIAAHQFRQDLIYKYKVHPDPSADQGLNQFANPFKTGKIAMVLDGGWQYWTTSDITEFKFGFAPVPMAKANKTINFDDFWIMGRWSTNKDTAWAVLRILTSVEATTKYSELSGTPPTPRESTDPWIKKVAEHTGQSVDDLKKLVSGAIETKRSQESPDHLFIQHPKIDDTYTNQIAALWNHSDATAEKVWPQITKAMDDVVLGIYNQFKDSRPKD